MDYLGFKTFLVNPIPELEDASVAAGGEVIGPGFFKASDFFLEDIKG